MTIIIQARMGSTRLPGKVLQKIGDKTIIEHVIDRCKQLTDKVIIATTSSSVLDLIPVQKRNRIEIFYSNYIEEDDLLKRYIMCGIVYDCDYILRVPADCPFFSLSAAEELIKANEKYKENIPCWFIYYNSITKWKRYDYIAHYLGNYTADNPIHEEYPTIWKHSTGQYLEVVRLSALLDVYNRIVRKEIKEKEIEYVYGLMDTIDCYKQHPTSGIYLEPERHSIKKIMIKKIPDHQLAINTADDLARVRALYEKGVIS